MSKKTSSIDNSEVVIITYHAYNRLKKRKNWNKKTADRMVKLIYQSGKREEDIKGYLKCYLKQKKREGSNVEFVLYGKDFYLFDGNVLVTVYSVPTMHTAYKAIA